MGAAAAVQGTLGSPHTLEGPRHKAAAFQQVTPGAQYGTQRGHGLPAADHHTVPLFLFKSVEKYAGTAAGIPARLQLSAKACLYRYVVQKR